MHRGLELTLWSGSHFQFHIIGLVFYWRTEVCQQSAEMYLFDLFDAFCV